MTAAPDIDQAYVDTLADQLTCRHTSLLATAEDDLAVLRAQIALTVAYINDPTTPEPTSPNASDCRSPAHRRE